MTLSRYHAIPPLLLPRPLRRGRIPGRQRPSFERDPPATPHPGRWLPHGTHLPFSFLRTPHSVDPHAPETIRQKRSNLNQREISRTSTSRWQPKQLGGSRCILVAAPTFMWGRSASALRKQPPLYRRALALGLFFQPLCGLAFQRLHPRRMKKPRVDAARAFAFGREPPHSCGGGALQRSEECAVFIDAL